MQCCCSSCVGVYVGRSIEPRIHVNRNGNAVLNHSGLVRSCAEVVIRNGERSQVVHVCVCVSFLQLSNHIFCMYLLRAIGRVWGTGLLSSSAAHLLRHALRPYQPHIDPTVSAM